MISAKYIPYTLKFKEPGGTSRGVMTVRKVWYLIVSDSENSDIYGIGECAPLPGLSMENMDNYERVLNKVCINIEKYFYEPELLKDYPSICFGVEMAWLDFRHHGKRRLYPSKFTDGHCGIKINGLIWMGTKDEMIHRIKSKLKHRFSCLKLKVGAIDFEQEYEILKAIRKRFSLADLEIRLDANGAFSSKDALSKLDKLSKLNIHSIEQPIKAGEWSDMAHICRQSQIPVALDEELIGINDDIKREEMLDAISPQYIILKPSLLGGFRASDSWVDLAEKKNITWWCTSALESNVGLNAIAQ